MQNIHTYYKQFQHLVQEDMQKGLAPIEKHLKAWLPYLIVLTRQSSDMRRLDQRRAIPLKMLLETIPSPPNPLL